MRLIEYARSRGRPELLTQWDKGRNLPLSPEEVGTGSAQKVWWRCERGHHWKATVTSRVSQGRGCPYCAGKLAMPGETDLKTLFPKIAAQWHPVRNKKLTPDQVTAGSEKSVWWCCEKGHEWQSLVYLRTGQRQGCPYCAGQRVIPGETDLATKHPLIAVLWHPTRNGEIQPSQILPRTHKRYWWQCSRGHEWQVSPSALVQGSGCPYCAGYRTIPGETDLATLYPTIAAQWHPNKNLGLSPGEIGPGNMKKVWWRCELCHDYQAPVYSRAQGTGCPYCAGKKVMPGFNDVGTLFPHLVGEWHPTLNGALTPQRVTKGSHKMIWWECREGHVWKAAVFSRTKKKGTGCPVCAGTVKRQTKEHSRIKPEKS